MGQHGDYGAIVLKRATDGRVVFFGPSVEVDYGRSAPARIDATLDSEIAIEIEARVPKQIRGAILDLICHPFPKKLLVIVPAHSGRADHIISMSTHIFSRFMDKKLFEICVLRGTGGLQELEHDAALLSAVIARLKMGDRSLNSPA